MSRLGGVTFSTARDLSHGKCETCYLGMSNKAGRSAGRFIWRQSAGRSWLLIASPTPICNAKVPARGRTHALQGRG
eukprot:2695896-Rhodomonas_salina.4